jgi:hypothetical protein
MSPEEVPPSLKKILDDAAGKAHSAEGPVMRCFAEILTHHERDVRAQVADQIEREYYSRDLAHGAYLRAAEIARGEG